MIYKRGFAVFLQKLFLVGLAVIAAVGADVSHLSENGYNYPQPSKSFSDELSQQPQPSNNQQYLPPTKPGLNTQKCINFFVNL